MKKIIILLVLCWNVSELPAQNGHFVLLGGGNTNIGGWSDAPFNWALNHSGNKRVAVIGYGSISNYIPNYFLGLGASGVKAFQINTLSLADAQSTYDSLMSYDVFYIMGGDQYAYYQTWQNTKTEDAIRDKFNTNGVICGTSAGTAILSKVFFSAANGTVYPYEVLSNINSPYITLKDDFLDVFDKAIFDTHFIERGRLARLAGFLAKRSLQNNEQLLGVGVDDKTAICIDTTGIGIVYGTGTVNIMYNIQSSNFRNNAANQLEIDALKMAQISLGGTFDFNTQQAMGTGTVIVPPMAGERSNREIMLASDDFSSSALMSNYFVNAMGQAEDTTLVVARNNTDANQAKLMLMAHGATLVFVLAANASNANNASHIPNIQAAQKILFLGNSYDDLITIFLNGGGAAGVALRQKIEMQGVVLGFLGEDVRFAGKTVIAEHSTSAYAAYDGDLVFKKGLGVLETMVILSNVYNTNSTTYYENQIAAVPYAMVLDSLKYGLWLNQSGLAHIYTQNDTIYLKSVGGYPAMLLENNGSLAGFTTFNMPSTGVPRQIAAFDEMYFSTLPPGTVKKIGKVDITISQKTVNKQHRIQLYPNPATDFLILDWSGNMQKIKILDVQGRRIMTKTISPKERIDISNWSAGNYYIQFENTDVLAFTIVR